MMVAPRKLARLLRDPTYREAIRLMLRDGFTPAMIEEAAARLEAGGRG